MNELDRQIAEKVMGEPEPEPAELVEVCFEEGPMRGEVAGFTYSKDSPSVGKNWRIVEIYEHGDVPEWEPMPFSTDLDQALRAVDKDRGNKPDNLGLTYLPDGTWRAGGLGRTKLVTDRTAPRAICNLLLVPVER